MAKYIKLRNNDFIVFPETMNHSDFKHLNPVSAGFYKTYISYETIIHSCYGESKTLGLISQEEDSKLISIYLSLNYY